VSGNRAYFVCASRYWFAMLLAMGLCLVALPNASAQSFSVIYNFTGGLDGSYPVGGLLMDRAGNMFGVASSGGSGDCTIYDTPGCGTIFRLHNSNGTWMLTPLYQFQGPDTGDGAYSTASPIFGNSGAIYGTTSGGGEGTCTFLASTGCGIVFALRTSATPPRNALPSWNEQVLHTFTGGDDGGNPGFGSLISDSHGNLYGVTLVGGANNDGVVYELSPSNGSWTQTILYNFQGGDDGARPVGTLLFDPDGDLIGTTTRGGGTGCTGDGCGTIFELIPSDSGWTEQTLYRFQGADDGFYPEAGLIADQAGNYYGGTFNGGAGGGGTVYELSPNGGGGWTLNVLYSFLGTQWGLANTLLMDASGNLYGTTEYGGVNADGNVFELTHNGSGASGWTYISLHDFTYGLDGAIPVDTPVMDSSGNLYGTAFGGGSNNTCNPTYGCGVVWKITP